MTTSTQSRPNYGIDAPAVLRNLFLAGGACLLLGIFLPRSLHIGSVTLLTHPTFLWPAGFLLGEAFLYLLYVKVGKFGHRDRILAFHNWRGDEEVLDVGTGRGLLLIGAAKRLTSGRAIGIDIWNKEDLSNNSATGTQQNIDLEGVAERCILISEAAQQMSFPDENFDVIVSNLCLHNIYDTDLRHKALAEIARVLKPGGIAILSDYKRTREYVAQLRLAGLNVQRKSANWLRTFPPLAIVVATKPIT